MDLDTGTELPDEDSSTGTPILADEFVKQAEPVKWAVDERIAMESMTIFAGAPKISRKTLLMLYMAECIAKGVQWLGRSCTKRPVIFTGFEGGAKLIALRILEVGHVSALTDDELPTPFSIGMGIESYEWVMSRMRQAVRAKEKWPIVWMMDTLSQVLAIKGIDENDNMEVTNFLREHDEMASKCGAAIMASHHFNKNQQVRGATAIGAICNVCRIHQVKDEESGILRLQWELRHGPYSVDGVKVGKPNGKFTFENFDPKNPKSSPVLIEAVSKYLKYRAGQDVSFSEIAAAMKGKTAGGKAPSLRRVEKICEDIAEEIGLTAATGLGDQYGGVKVASRPSNDRN